MNAIESAPDGFRHCPLVEPLAWRPAFQAWQERADSTRDLAALVTDGQAKELLLMIAETYEQLASQ